jgi:hypothetical protein
MFVIVPRLSASTQTISPLDKYGLFKSFAVPKGVPDEIIEHCRIGDNYA